jgi:hypothetical protein
VLLACSSPQRGDDLSAAVPAQAADDRQLTKTIARYGRVDRPWTRSWATWNSTTGTDSYRLRATQARHHATGS